MQAALDDRHIAEAAIIQFEQETGLQLRFENYEAHGAGGFLTIQEIGTKLTVEVKKWATHTPIGTLINKVREIAEPGGGILIADYINPKMAEKLKAAEIQFLDTVGNAYLNRKPVYVYINGKKPPQKPTVERRGRALQPTGLKVVYAFLTDRELINAPYREIAERADVALGAVGWVIRDLIEQGFLIEGKNKKRRLTNYDDLLDMWVENYPQRLRKKLLLGNFTTDEENWWHKINPCAYKAVWGGEIAAAEYTNYLTPKDGTVYLQKETMNLFLKDARLRRTQEFERPHINIELLEPFGNFVASNNTLANPILVYADLLATGNIRNIETAQKLREKYIN